MTCPRWLSQDMAGWGQTLNFHFACFSTVWYGLLCSHRPQTLKWPQAIIWFTLCLQAMKILSCVFLPFFFLLTKQWRPKGLSNLSKHGGIQCLEKRDPLWLWSEEHHFLLARSLQCRPHKTCPSVLSSVGLLFFPSRILLHFLWFSKLITQASLEYIFYF